MVTGRAWLAVVVAAVLVAAGPAEAAATRPFHTGLVSAEPAKDTALVASPPRIRLVFSEPVVASLSEVAVEGASGHALQVVLESDPHDVHALIGPLPALAPGAYLVRWRIVSADGHAVSGSYRFRVLGDTSAAGAPAEPDAPDSSGAAAPGAAPGDVPRDERAIGEVPVGSALLRGLGVGCLMGMAGLLFFARLGARGASRRLARLVDLLAIGAGVLLLAHFATWLVQAAPERGIDAAWLQAALRTPVALVELARAAFALLALWALVLARRPSLALIFAALAIVASAVAGHAAAVGPEWNVPAKLLHLGAASVWLGGLLWLLVAEQSEAGFPARAARVSSAGLWSVIVIAFTGIVQARLLLTSFGDLVHTAYGALVLGKAAGLLVLVLFGAYHRYRVLPGRGGALRPADLRTTVRAEVAVMVVVLLVAGILAYTPTPPVQG